MVKAAHSETHSGAKRNPAAVRLKDLYPERDRGFSA